MATTQSFDDSEVEYYTDLIVKHLQEKDKDDKLEEWYVKAATELEDSGLYAKAEIAAVLQKKIRDKLFPNDPDFEWHSGYFYRIMSSRGWTNAAFDHRSGDVPLGERPHSSLNTYELENYDELEYYQRLVAFIKETVIKKMSERSVKNRILLVEEIKAAFEELEAAKKTGDKISIDVAAKRLEDLEHKANQRYKVYKEHCYVREMLLKRALESYDERVSVEAVEQHQLMMLIAEFNVAGGAEIFKTQVKEISLVPKQAHKYKAGEVRELIALYDPKNREEARKVEFYGQQCTHIICKKCGNSSPPSTTVCQKEIIDRRHNTTHACGGQQFTPCGSWRTKLDKEASDTAKLHCFACLATFGPVETLPLPVTKGRPLDEKMSKMFNETFPDWKVKNGICPSCNSIMSQTRTAEGTKFTCNKCGTSY